MPYPFGGCSVVVLVSPSFRGVSCSVPCFPLLKKAFCRTRGAGFAQTELSVAQSLGWANKWYLRRGASRPYEARSTMYLFMFFLVADASETDVRCSGLLRTFSSSTRPASSNVTFVRAIESIGDAWLPQSSSCVLLQNDAMWPGLSGCARDGASCDYGPHAGCARWLPPPSPSSPPSPPTPPPNAPPVNSSIYRLEHLQTLLGVNRCTRCRSVVGAGAMAQLYGYYLCW